LRKCDDALGGKSFDGSLDIVMGVWSSGRRSTTKTFVGAAEDLGNALKSQRVIITASSRLAAVSGAWTSTPGYFYGVAGTALKDPAPRCFVRIARSTTAPIFALGES
jgi:hypothetical protein